MKIANDNPKLSFLLPFYHSCSPSIIPAPLLSFLRKQESRVVACKKEKAKTLDPLLDWIHSLIGSPIRSGTGVGDKRQG